MRRIILAALVLALGATGAQADPILTPLLVTAGLGGTAVTIGTVGVTYASLAPYCLKAAK